MEVGQQQLVFHVRLAGDPEDMLTTVGLDQGDMTDVQALALGHAAFENEVVPMINEEYEYVGADFVRQESGGAVVTSNSVSTAGGRSGAPAIPNTAVLARKLTAGIGRGKNGRMYIPGATVADLEQTGALTSGARSAWNAALADFLTALNAGITTQVAVVNRSTPPGGSTEEITSLVCDARVATQRRRLRP